MSIFQYVGIIGIVICIGLIYLVDKENKNRLERAIQRAAGIIVVVFMLSVNLPVVATLSNVIANNDIGIEQAYIQEIEYETQLEYIDEESEDIEESRDGQEEEAVCEESEVDGCTEYIYEQEQNKVKLLEESGEDFGYILPMPLSTTIIDYVTGAGDITVANGDTLIVIAGGVVNGQITVQSGGKLYIESGSIINARVIVQGTATMNGGEISGNTVTGNGGAVSVSGTFEMNGGEISGNTATGNGGAVSVSGTFIMNGGEISGNTATGNGGGVFFSAGGNFTMNGGEISDNTAASGGGVFSHRSVIINNGEISGNTAQQNGGGVVVVSQSLIMNGGEISENTTQQNGGGVHTFGFAMHGGKISGNTAQQNGGGVLAHEDAIMHGGEISGNTAQGAGGLISTEGNFIMHGGEVIDNTALNATGGVSANDVIIYDGEINGNTAGTNAGGVRSWGFTMHGGEVSGNTAGTNAGGVMAGMFTMHGGEINENIAGTDGGGVLIQYSFMMHDGEINGNAATNRGGGVFMEDESFIMSGGEISENTAGTDGGGVFTNNRLVIHGGEISRNTAQQNGGGVYTLHLTMHDGEINANIAYGNGGGMYLINDCCCHEYDAERAMYGGRISNNIANNGGGVFINHNDGNIQSLTIKSVFVFTGNVARDGLYINNPMASLNPQIEPETISIIGTHAFTNYDINVRNEPQDRVYLVTFAVRDGLGGTLTSGNTTVTGQQIGQVVVEYGTEILFTAAPDNNWESKAWYINNVRQTGEIANILTYIVEGSGPHHIEILFTVEEQIQVFNLALRTFITQVETNGNVTNLNRAPVVTMPDNFLTGLVYTFPLNKVANPVQMANGSYVVHTIRVFNEGTLAGYVNEIRNEIPQGLEFVPNHPINVNYEWVINGTELRTRYLENNQIGAFNPLLPIETGNPEYRDVQIVLRITGTGNNQPGNVLRIQASIEEAEAVGNGQAEYINLLEEEIDTEYVEIQYFDLGLTKWINFVEVTTGGSTRTRNYAMPADARGSDFLVMTSIRRRDIMSSRVEVAYTIRIRNEAQIEGYAREITLNVPEGMMLVPANNPLWELVDSNTAITRQLEDVLLEEGEYTDIEVILTWRNSGENFGAKRSVATITESYNSSGSLDIDESNDYDYAVKMVVKATGGTDIAMTVIGMMMALSVLGLVSTMKKVEMQV